MDITYLGHSSFKIKGKNKTVVTDPYGDKVGKYPKDVEADIVTVSHDHFDHNAVDKVKGNPFLINGPGEYEVGGVSVIGIPTFHDETGGSQRGRNTMFIIEVDGLRVAHLGDLGHKFTDAELEDVGSIDILMVPVGGTYTIDHKAAKEITAQIDPTVVIPMHYATPEGGVEGLGTLETFLQEMGKAGTVPVSKYSVTLDRLPEELQVVVLEKK